MFHSYRKPVDLSEDDMIKVDYNSVRGQHDFISLTSVEWIRYPLCRCTGRENVISGFVDAQNLSQSLRLRPRDPLTTQPINMNEYKVVWFENLPALSNAQYNVDDTIREFMRLKQIYPSFQPTIHMASGYDASGRTNHTYDDWRDHPPSRS